MLKIARWTMAHRRFVVIAWIVATVGIFAVSNSIGKKTASDFTLPGTGSQHAVDLLRSRFPAQAGDADQIVFQARTGRLTDEADRATVASTLARVSHLPHVASVVSPYAAGQHTISRDGSIGFATVSFDQRANALPKEAIDRVITTAESARSARLQVELGGQAIEQAQQASLGFATVIGIAAAIVILLLSFGSFTAMGLPIATALLGLGAGVGLITLASHVVNMPDFASELALMIGLGVGIDYALFIVTRFREGYRNNGGDVQRAVEEAINTSGRAVLFAGVTVVIALLGMFALGVNLLNGAAVAASLGVVLVLSASLTLLPALLSLTGRRIGERGRRATRGVQSTKPGFWLRWVRQVQRRPAVTAIAATALMLVLAAPALGLRLASSDAGNDPSHQTTRKAYDLLAKGFGPGFNGPLQVAVALPRPHDTSALRTALRRPERHVWDRLGRAAAAQRERRCRGGRRVPVELTAERVDGEPGHALARQGDPAARAAHGRARVRRRSHGIAGGLLSHPLAQAAAVHRCRCRAGRAAAGGGLPIACDPGAGRGHEPALDRSLARCRASGVRARLARRAARRSARTD